MSDSLDRLLLRTERAYPALVSREDIEDWLDGVFLWGLERGIFKEAPPAQELPCRNCDEQPLLRVVFLGDPASCAQAYLPCPFCGPVAIEAGRMQQWYFDYIRLLELAIGARLASSSLRELIPRRLWLLGTANLAGVRWNVAAGRALHLTDGVEVLNRSKLPCRSIIFAPAHLPCGSLASSSLPNIVPLRSVLSWDKKLRLDETQLAAAITPTAIKTPVARPRKRATRAAIIEGLTQQLKEHVRSAQDHALATAERRGLPELLPRPSQRQLAKRAGVSEVAVSRCLRDPAARELRLLWETANDLDRVMSLSRARPR